MTSPLTTGQRALLKAQMELRLSEINRQIELHQEGRTRVEHARDVLERDYDDAPQRAMDREVDLALSDIDLQELRAIGRALKHLDGPDYGLCVDCSAEIPFDRLRIEPYAERCVACESKHELASRAA